MAESTINVNAPIDQNTPMRELNSTMNYLVAQTATGINLNKKISGQISSLSMNVGKVISTTNGVIREVALSNQKLDVFSNKLDTIDGSIKELIGVVKSGSGTEKTNRSIGNLSQRVTALVSRQDELNKTIQSYFTSSKKNEYESLEVKLEQRNDMLSESLKGMTETLVSIDKTLKGMSNISGNNGNAGPSPNIPLPSNRSTLATIGALLLGGGGLYTLFNNTSPNLFGDEKTGLMGSQASGYGQMAAAGALAGSQFGPYGALAGSALGVTVGSAFDRQNLQDYGRSMGLSYSSEETSDRKKQFLEQTKGTKFTSSDDKYYIDGYEVEKSSYEAGIQQIREAGGNPNINGKETPRGNITGFNLDISKLLPPESPVEAVPQSKTEPIRDAGNKERVSVNSSMPYFPRVGSADIPLGSFNTRDMLEAQQAEIENKAKGMTSSDMLYEAADVIYKASTIRFEASNIQFLGALGAAGGVGAMGGASLTGGPYNNGGGPGNTFNQGGGNGDVAPIGAARLTPEQKKAIDELEKTGKYVPGVNETSALSSLTDEQLASMGITKSTAPGPGGQTEYTYDKEANKNADFIPKEARALLDTISAPGLEGADYNTVVGGSKFSDYGQHPGRVGVVTAQGPSTAAGRYQITGTTWKELQAKYPDLKDFSPENQDKAAWYLAQERYAKATGGRKLEEDLKSNDPNIIQGVSRALSGTWASLEGGVHQGSGAGKFNKMFSENLQNGSKGPRGSLADQVGNALPEKYIAATPGGAKIKESYGPKRPGQPNEGIMNIGQVAATAAGMETIEYTSGKGNWNSPFVKPGGKTMHSTGNAVDAAGFESEEQKIAFIENAVAAGANGIGVYGDGSVHIDTGEFRSWALAKNKKYQDAIKRGMDRRKNGDIPGTDGKIAEAAKASPDIAADSKKPYIAKPRPKPSTSAKSEKTESSVIAEPVTKNPSMFMMNPTQRAYDEDDPSFSGMGIVGNQYNEDMLKPDAKIETQSSKNAASVIRTDTLRQEEARVNDGKNEQRRRESEKMTQAIQNREAPGPKNPKVEKKELRDVLRSHRNWYDDYWVSRV